MGLVNDGTSCVKGKICIENVCVPLSQVSPVIHCPSNNLALQCSGHGVIIFYIGVSTVHFISTPRIFLLI